MGESANESIVGTYLMGSWLPMMTDMFLQLTRLLNDNIHPISYYQIASFDSPMYRDVS